MVKSVSVLLQPPGLILIGGGGGPVGPFSTFKTQIFTNDGNINGSVNVFHHTAVTHFNVQGLFNVL